MDLGDGELQKQYDAYMSRLKLVDGVSREIHDGNQRLQTCSDLRVIVAQLKEDDKGSRNINHVIVCINLISLIL